MFPLARSSVSVRPRLPLQQSITGDGEAFGIFDAAARTLELASTSRTFMIGGTRTVCGKLFNAALSDRV